MKNSVSLKIPLLMAATVLAAGPALAQSANWTGAYIGAEVGGANFKVSVPGASADNDDIIGGIIAGYDYDFGTFVIGGGVDLDFTDNRITPGASAKFDRVWRIKLRGGAKIGNGLAYATGGYTNAHAKTVGSEDGYFVGGGYEHKIMPNFTVGGEVLYHDYGKFKSTGASVEVISYQIRGTFRF